eukprot:sb/3471150/
MNSVRFCVSVGYEITPRWVTLGTQCFGVTIAVEGIDKDITVRHPSGFYWRPLQPGVYNITASKTGYFPLTYKNIVVKEGESTVVNFILISRNQREFKDMYDQIDGTQSTFNPTRDPRLRDMTLPRTQPAPATTAAKNPGPADGEGDNEKSGEKQEDQDSEDNDPKDSSGVKLIPTIFLQTIIPLMRILH